MWKIGGKALPAGAFSKIGFYTSFNGQAIAAGCSETLFLFWLLHSKLRQPGMPAQPRSASVFIFIVFLFTSCKHTDRQVTRAIYHWKNSSYIENEQRLLMQQHSISRLYVKLMDIDWQENRGAIPLGINHLEDLGPNIFIYDSSVVELVPVIFITNKTFTRIDSADIPLLATRILRKCFTAYDETDSQSETRFAWLTQRYKLHPAEIQFDCDWTESTASKYFYFLETVKKLLPDASTEISATIRLHQYKYSNKTGVPPVNKGMLMVYNISEVTKYTPVNSIFEYDKAKPYFNTGKEYSLPLDLALAAYSWGIVYRDKKFFTIEHGMMPEMLQQKEYFRLNAKNIYTVRKDTLLNNLFLRPGDEIKIESIDEKRLMQAANLARRALNNDSLTVSLFELSSPTLKNYSHETIEQVFNSFR